MKVFLPIATTQTIKVIPRADNTAILLDIRNEETDVTVRTALTGTFLNGYLSVAFTYDFIEGGSYEVDIYTATEEILWRGKAYATAQTDLENFKINKDILTA